MYRLGIWFANSGLFALCCYLVATLIVRLVFAAEPAALEAPEPLAARARPPRANPEIILQRNLFNVASLGLEPVETQPEEEDLVATKLPLRLLGTVAAGNPELSWAAIEDLEKREHRVVRVDDVVADRASVVRIERRRIVLQNGPRREELALDEDGAGGAQASGRPTPRQRAAAAPARRTPPDRDALAARVRQLNENRFAIQKEDVRAAARNPAALFSQARILPKYQEGQMVGVQLNAVKPGSVFEQIGIRDGDIVVEFNGTRIESPQQSAELMRQLSQTDQLSLTVEGSDGQERTLNYTFE